MKAIAVLMMAPLLLGCSQATDREAQRNIETVKRLHAEAWSQGNLEILDEILGDDYVKHWGAFEATIGRDALKQSISSLRASFPDWNEKIQEIAATGDLVFARWTETGTFTNDIDGISANGAQIKAAGMGWFRFENGLLVEEWTIVDNWGTQLQIGGSYDGELHKPGWDPIAR